MRTPPRLTSWSTNPVTAIGLNEAAEHRGYSCTCQKRNAILNDPNIPLCVTLYLIENYLLPHFGRICDPKRAII